MRPLFDRWRDWLDLPVEELASKLLDPGLLAREMRQVTPFAGLLEPKERVRILKQFRREYERPKQIRKLKAKIRAAVAGRIVTNSK